jgi:hypothetical protein
MMLGPPWLRKYTGVGILAVLAVVSVPGNRFVPAVALAKDVADDVDDRANEPKSVAGTPRPMMFSTMVVVDGFDR